jgi:hypothetical protein
MKLIKKLILAIVVLFVITFPTDAQEITSNILTRVFLIKYGDKFGFSFTIEVQDRQYLIQTQ